MSQSSALFAVVLTVSALGALGCEPTLDVGSFTCPKGDSTTSPENVTMSVPWSTGFEHHFCDYQLPEGYCYVGGGGSYDLVTSPVHSGRYAAAFSVHTNGPGESQARCVRQGLLPTSAYYGAWYFIPAQAKNMANWNLVHFQGPRMKGIWDVSLVNDNTTGELKLALYDFMANKRYEEDPVALPTGRWVHLQISLKLATDPTGQVIVYQDGQPVIELDDLVTTDTTWGQFYVGNLATDLTPPDSTLYVDDVTISDSL